jgi:hypothetical protein
VFDQETHGVLNGKRRGHGYYFVALFVEEVPNFHDDFLLGDATEGSTDTLFREKVPP